MALLKKGVSYGNIIVSKMVFSCTRCQHVEAMDIPNYDPAVEMICNRCQGIMLLISTNTDVDKKTITDENKPSPSKE